MIREGGAVRAVPFPSARRLPRIVIYSAHLPHYWNQDGRSPQPRLIGLESSTCEVRLETRRSRRTDGREKDGNTLRGFDRDSKAGRGAAESRPAAVVWGLLAAQDAAIA